MSPPRGIRDGPRAAARLLREHARAPRSRLKLGAAQRVRLVASCCARASRRSSGRTCGPPRREENRRGADLLCSLAIVQPGLRAAAPRKCRGQERRGARRPRSSTRSDRERSASRIILVQETNAAGCWTSAASLSRRQRLELGAKSPTSWQSGSPAASERGSREVDHTADRPGFFRSPRP